MDKQADLARAQRWPLALLALFALLFVATHWMPASGWSAALKAMAEAAMVGALADWFAVVALFRRVPLPLVGRHTDIIARNKDRIADNLAVFVQDKFLNGPALVALIRQHDPAQRVAHWLGHPDNAAQLGRHAASVVGMALDVVGDARIERFLKDAVRTLIGKIDMAPALATVLDGLTKDGRHQALLDEALERLAELLRQPQARAVMAQTIVQWLQREYPKAEKLLPTQTLGDKGAAMLASAIEDMLADVARNPAHALRERFDAAVLRFVERLRNDAQFQARGERVKHYLQQDEKLGAYVQALWSALRAWLRHDLGAAEPALARNATHLGVWLGQALAGDAALRASLNSHLHSAAERMAPDFGAFLAGHIRDTVAQWEVRELSRQVELNIGKDLQYIRINGTLVGAAIGLALFALSHAPQWLQWLAAGR